MKKSKKLNRSSISWYIHFILFILATIALRYIWIYDYNTRLNNPNKAEPDPIWQIIYLIAYMPLLALIYWISEGWKKYRFIIPLISLIVAFIFFITSYNSHIVQLSDMWIAVPSAIASLIWIWLFRIIHSIIRAITKKTATNE